MNRRGRPLEFHCSAPVQTNRAQEILYGPTLRPFLFGELVGKTLIEHAQLPVDAILVDSPDALDLRKAMDDVPVAMVADARETGVPFVKQPPGLSGSGLSAPSLSMGSFLLTFAPGYEEDAVVLEGLLALIDDLDLCEPFERICAALEEAQRISA